MMFLKQYKGLPSLTNLISVGLPLLFLSLFFATGCTPSTADPLPRPSGWPRIDLPTHEYQKLENGPCPFSFEFPIVGDLEATKADSCWMDIYFKSFECRWHITYRHIPSSGKTLAQHNEEYRKLVFKHIQKVSQIKENPIQTDHGTGMFYELFGTVGVPAQMIFTDSTHLVMASFYFDSAVRNDSLAPVIDFVKEDMKHMAESIRWKN